MTMLGLALAAFILLHSIPAIPPLRAALVARLGRVPYLVLYSLVSIVTIAWVFHATFAMETTMLWAPAAWQAWIPLVLSPVALWLLVSGLASPNPFSVSMRAGDVPGAITTVTRHPVLWGFALWSASHIPPNGDLRALLLFGALTGFALFGIWIGERRGRRRLGAGWDAAVAGTSIVPLAALLSGRARPRADLALVGGLAIAALLTAWLLWGGHAMLFAADPLALAQS